MKYKARLNADGQFDTEATLDLIDEIVRKDISIDECTRELRELFEDALTVSNSECYEDGLADGKQVATDENSIH